MSVALDHSPQVDADGVTFSLPDPDGVLVAVHLHQEIMRPRRGPAFARARRGAAWTLRLARPKADRMEYMFELERADGGSEITCDPSNPRHTSGPFGHKSVIEWPEYRAPDWISMDVERGTSFEASITSRFLRAEIRTVIWNSPGADGSNRVPLLVAHDGPEYDQYSQLTHALAVAVATGDLPPMRAALLGPVERNHTYSASAAYGRALSLEVLPVLAELAPTPPGRAYRAGMGASLGALAMLHVHRTNPASFGGLFLQSGSFFRQRFDRQESNFVRFRRISRFVGRVLSNEGWVHTIPVAMTCGTAEENIYNNNAVFAALHAQGYDVTLHKNRDAHNWIAWRDTFHPHLIDLLKGLWL